MSFMDTVRANFTLPYEPFGFQEHDVIEPLGPLDASGFYLDMGTGKTLSSTYKALGNLASGKIGHAVVVMPPILIQGWYRFLSKIPEIKALPYEGTPRQREAVKLGHSDFTLVSMDIFKRDHDRFITTFRKSKAGLIIDEATSIKNISTANHKRVLEFPFSTIDLLTGTPISSPADAYAYCKIVAPGVYRNQNQFNNIHIDQTDFFGKVTKWRHLDLLAANMQINAVRLLRTDVLKDLPDVTYQEVPYNLHRDHMKLYQTLVEDRLLVLSSGGKIDATTPTRLYHAMQQIVLNWAYFSQDESKRPAGFDVIDQALEETNGKLIVCATYRMTNEALMKAYAKHKPVIAYGGNTPAQNRRAVDIFCEDPSRKLFFMQPSSAGIGTDGLQEVCRDMLFIECPIVPLPFHQAVARLQRQGAKSGINIKVGTAQGTIQSRLLADMLAKDRLVGSVVPNVADLRRALYGG